MNPERLSAMFVRTGAIAGEDRREEDRMRGAAAMFVAMTSAWCWMR
jgi:hypothetical protein